MLVKYGKPVDMRSINRTVEAIDETIEKSARRMKNAYRKSGGVKPKCRICGSGQSTLFAKLLGKYEYFQCEQCQALFLGEIPDIQNLYCGENAVNSSSYIDDAVYDRRVEMITAPKIQFVLDACRSEELVKLDSWLDIGCGGGEILSWLTRNSDIKAEGIESDEKECRFMASRGLKVKNCYIDLEHEDAQISQMIRRNDVVSFFNVLEHMEEPGRFINYVYDHMHEHAVLVFEVPRHPSVASFANMTGSNFIYRHVAALGHLQVFSEKSLALLLRDKFRMIGKCQPY